VIETRSLAEGTATRRRRICNACGYRFTSYERIEEQPLMVIKRDGRREPFDRAKIENGVGRAIQKRPIARMAVERLVNEVEDEAALKAGNTNEIASQDIGEMVLERLNRLDNVAYIRFASVCRHFENLDEFVQEIKLLRKKEKKELNEAAKQR
jgi:transcriptional repressor NrdR